MYEYTYICMCVYGYIHIFKYRRNEYYQFLTIVGSTDSCHTYSRSYKCVTLRSVVTFTYLVTYMLLYLLRMLQLTYSLCFPMSMYTTVSNIIILLTHNVQSYHNRNLSFNPNP